MGGVEEREEMLLVGDALREGRELVVVVVVVELMVDGVLKCFAI